MLKINIQLLGGRGSSTGGTAQERAEYDKTVREAAAKSKGALRYYASHEEYENENYDEDGDPIAEYYEHENNTLDVVSNPMKWNIDGFIEAKDGLSAAKKFAKLLKKTRDPEISDWTESIVESVENGTPSDYETYYNPYTNKHVGWAGSYAWGVENVDGNNWYVYLNAPKYNSKAYNRALDKQQKVWSDWAKH